MKKTLLTIIFIFISNNVYAKCPNLTGHFKCVDANGKLFKQSISIKENPFTYIFNREGKKIEYIVNGKNQKKVLKDHKTPLFMEYRGNCTNNIYRNEFLLDDKMAFTARGYSEYKLSEEGFNIYNKVFLAFDEVRNNVESCKKIN